MKNIMDELYILSNWSNPVLFFLCVSASLHLCGIILDSLLSSVKASNYLTNTRKYLKILNWGYREC